MAVNRITVTLEQPEYRGLLEVAAKELRDPSQQLRHILRQELERCNLLPKDGTLSGGQSQEVQYG